MDKEMDEEAVVAFGEKMLFSGLSWSSLFLSTVVRNFLPANRVFSPRQQISCVSGPKKRGADKQRILVEKVTVDPRNAIH